MKVCIPDIIEKVKSGIIHIVHVVDGQRVSSGTGFMVKGYLVTNYHVIYDAPHHSKIILRTYGANPNKPLEGIIELERDEDGIFRGRTNKGYKNEESEFIKDFSEKNQKDYIIFNIPELREGSPDLYNFSFSDKDKRIGEEVFFLGHHFNNSQPVCHKGIISCSYYHQNHGLDIIQIDASVNNGNSGSPLIDPDTSNVIGIITQKECGLSENFDQMYLLIKKNIEILYSEKVFLYLRAEKQLYKSQMADLFAGNPINHDQIKNVNNDADKIANLIDAIVDNNSKLMELLKEIKRSANVGIGYAYSTKHFIKKSF